VTFVANPVATGVAGRPLIEAIHVRNYRALKDVELKELTPLTVLLGPNGSGKSTLFDVFNFLSETFKIGLRSAWDQRNRGREIRSRGESGPVVIELRYREAPRQPVITYHLSIDERAGAPVVAEEWMRWTRSGGSGRPFKFLDYKDGRGSVISGNDPDNVAERSSVPLRSADLLAVNTLGQLAEHPRVAALREFVMDWYVSYLTIDSTREQPVAGPQEHLNKTGSNLANVIQHLLEQHPGVLTEIFRKLSARVPQVERIQPEIMADGRLLLLLKDRPFKEPILAKFASDGTLKLLAYLVVLNDPSPPRFIGVEEPENFLFPSLLQGLGEECRAASERAQLLVTTHSPLFIEALQPKEVRVLYRGDDGFTRIARASEIEGIPQFIAEGATIGELFAEGRLSPGSGTSHARPAPRTTHAK
jgi:predicted ATPase